MKYAVLMIVLLFSCAGTTRIAPRDVSRASSVLSERAELVEAVESEINESNRLRGELAAVHAAEASERAELVVDPGEYTPRLIVFTAVEWCAPCKKFDAEIKRLAEMTYAGADGKQHEWFDLIGTGSDKAIQVVDLSSEDDSESADLAVKYGIDAVPTVIRIDAAGKQESRFEGWMNAETLCRYQAGKWKPPKIPLNAKTIVFLK